MNITVLGCGRWGSFHAWYADHIGHTVTLWGRDSSPNLKELMTTRKNEYVTLPSSILLTSDLIQAISSADICILSISAQQVRSFAKQLHDLPVPLTKPIILAMKG